MPYIFDIPKAVGIPLSHFEEIFDHIIEWRKLDFYLFLIFSITCGSTSRADPTYVRLALKGSSMILSRMATTTSQVANAVPAPRLTPNTTSLLV